MDPAIIVAMSAVALAVVTLVVVLPRGRRDPAAEAQQNQMLGKLAQLSVDNADRQDRLMKAMNERLDGVRKHLGDGLAESATKTAKSLGELQTRLNVIDQAQKNITELSGQVVGLQDILANKQARGAFGEIQLGDLLRDALPPSAYELQATLGNNRRADCLVRLPNPPGPIVIDAKFPLEAYVALRAAENEAEKTVATRAFRDSILKHVKDIAERYILPGETAETAMMFLPSEAVYAELHANFREVVEASHRLRVWIVSPSTMMATLTTVRAVLKDVRMREQAGVIQREVTTMLDDVARLDDRVGKLQRHFGQAEEDMRQVRISTDKVTKRGERIQEVELEDPAATAPPLEGPKAVAGD